MHIRRLTTHLLPKSNLEVGAEANITITSIRFSLAIKIVNLKFIGAIIYAASITAYIIVR